MTESWDEVVASLTAAYGLHAWGTTLGHGSFLTVELGEPESPGSGHGRYHLWLYLTAWRIEDGATMLAGSEDDRDELAGKVTVLDGRKLVSVAIEPPSMSARFEFEGELVLTTFSVYSSHGDHWLLFRPDGTVLTMGPGSDWSVEAADHPNRP